MTRAASQHQFTSSDGARLAYRHWQQTQPTSTKQAIVLLHRGHEHSGRMQNVVDQLNLPEFDFFAWDARGHGLSDGERGYARHFGVLVADLAAFVQHISQNYAIPLENIAVVAQSVGAVIATTWVHDYAPPIRALVLASPALRVRLYVPLAIPGLRVLNKIKPVAFITSYVKGKFLTHDAQKAQSYNTDPLVSPRIAVNILLGLHDTATRLLADAHAMQVPMQLLISGSDFVVHQPPQHQLFKNWGCPVKEKHVFDGFLHDTLNEKDGHLALEKARVFLQQRFAQPRYIADLRQADSQGYTYAEMQQLSQALPAYHPKAWFFGLYRGFLKSVGLVSNGIRTGVTTGFDSGSTLDFVYRNQADSPTLIGRSLDRVFLDNIGWRGIRQRKLHLQALITQAAQLLHTAGKPVQVLDIAAGHGRYMVDALAQLPMPYQAQLRDYRAINVEQGQALIASRGLQAHIRFTQADAFATASYQALTPAPTLAVISGLFELFGDNTRINTALQGLGQNMAAGSYLVYTNQPWHPQLEMIARGLTNHQDGSLWVMRRRTQAEIDQLVHDAGFDKTTMLIDEWGMFSVSLAIKRPVM